MWRSRARGRTRSRVYLQRLRPCRTVAETIASIHTRRRESGQHPRMARGLGEARPAPLEYGRLFLPQLTARAQEHDRSRA